MGCAGSVPDRGRRNASSETTLSANRSRSASSTTPNGHTHFNGRFVSTATADTATATNAPRDETALPGDERKLVLIVWDIENVRLPEYTAPGLTPTSVVGYLKRHFITDQQRVEYRTVAAVTELSLKALKRVHPDFVKEMVPHCNLMMACAREGGYDKRDADVVLKKELEQFILEYAHLARARPSHYTIALITGDEDFLGPVQSALRAGFNVELLYHDSASSALLAQNYSRPPCLWSHFLAKYSGILDVPLPYGDDRLLRLLSRGGVLVAGFDRKRGGFTDADRAVCTALRNVHDGHNMYTKVVDPSNGMLSKQLGVVVTPKSGGCWALAEAESVAKRLKQWRRWPPNVVVVEPGQVLRLTLRADDDWIPGCCSGGGPSSSYHTASDRYQSPSAAGPEPSPAGHPAAALAVAGGRSSHQRLLEAGQLVERAVNGGMEVLCRVGWVPRAGRLARTVLYYVPSGTRGIEDAVGRLGGLVSELWEQHGVGLRLLKVTDQEKEDEEAREMATGAGPAAAGSGPQAEVAGLSMGAALGSAGDGGSAVAAAAAAALGVATEAAQLRDLGAPRQPHGGELAALPGLVLEPMTSEEQGQGPRPVAPAAGGGSGRFTGRLTPLAPRVASNGRPWDEGEEGAPRAVTPQLSAGGRGGAGGSGGRGDGRGEGRGGGRGGKGGGPGRRRRRRGNRVAPV